jgi:hypothetical protein
MYTLKFQFMGLFNTPHSNSTSNSVTEEKKKSSIERPTKCNTKGSLKDPWGEFYPLQVYGTSRAMVVSGNRKSNRNVATVFLLYGFNNRGRVDMGTKTGGVSSEMSSLVGLVFRRYANENKPGTNECNMGRI